MKKRIFLGCAGALLVALAAAPLSAQASAPATQNTAVKQMGSIRKITGSELALATDKGVELVVKVQSGAHLWRLAPGQTDLKNAAPIEFTDLQVGDRVLVRGRLASDGNPVEATSVIVVKQQDIAQVNQQELLDWQKRSVGGLVSQVDSQQGNITISVSGTGSNRMVVVSTTPKTTFKRYSADSVKWADATTATISDIHPGDQLRAKGNKNEDGTQVIAEEIVAGTFRNIAGLITSINPARNSLTVQDLATKKPVTVKITAESQMKKLPVQMAQGIAMRMKPAAPATPSSAARLEAAPGESARPRGSDLNQALARLPAATLGDLQKGEAVMIVSTQGSSSESPLALTLLGGVEAILTALPTGKGAETFLTPWSLASAPASDQ